MKNYHSVSSEETEAIAEVFAKELKPGDVVAFLGGMGVGKTAFVRGMARGLGCFAEVSSPTFALVHEYAGPLPLYHFDMYRVSSLEDLYTTGYFDYLEAGGILAVEWSENIEGILDENVIRVSLCADGETVRTIKIEGGGRF